MGKKKEYQSRGVEIVKIVWHSGYEDYRVLDTMTRNEFMDGVRLGDVRSIEFHSAILVDGGTK